MRDNKGLEISEANQHTSKKTIFSKNTIIIIVVVVVVAVTALAIGLGVGLGLKSDSSVPGFATTVSPSALPVLPEQLTRIDCYPEQRWGDVDAPAEVVRDGCLRRGCTYDADQLLNPDVPRCYVSPDCSLGAGYRASEPEVRENGFRISLGRNQASKTASSGGGPQPDIVSTDAVFLVEYGDENVLRVKVCQVSSPYDYCFVF